MSHWIVSTTFGLVSVALSAMAPIVRANAQTQAPDDWTIGPFSRPAGVNPVISPDPTSTFSCPISGAPVHWEALHTFNPAAIVRDGHVVVLYRAEDDTGKMAIGGHTSRIGYALSSDGLHFSRSGAPVFFPDRDASEADEWPGGCEDPRVVEAPDGQYVLTYTQWNRRIFHTAVATSRDLKTWTKHGPIFAAASGGRFADMRYKSSSIVTQLTNGRLIAARINGKFWMYWGEGSIHLATSDNLVDWTPLLDAGGKPLAVLARRPGRFDSAFPEAGPPAVLTKHGIVLLYNGKNNAHGDPAVGVGSYSGGQALFDARDPARLIARTDRPFFQPQEAFERTGQYAQGTTFLEGLVYFDGRWLLYYGCADSLVAVAECRPAARMY